MKEINVEEKDILVKFMHPHGPSRSFHWPYKEDLCFIPMMHILTILDTPTTATGRQYSISRKETEQANAMLLSSQSF